MVSGRLSGLDASTLATLKASAIAGIECVTKTGKSYSVAGRSYSFSELGELMDLLGEINYAIALVDGSSGTTTLADFRRRCL